MIASLKAEFILRLCSKGIAEMKRVESTLVNRNLLEQLATRATMLMNRIAQHGKKASLNDVNQLHLTVNRLLTELIQSWERLRLQHAYIRTLWSDNVTNLSRPAESHENYRQEYSGGWGRTTCRGRSAKSCSLPDRVKTCQIEYDDIKRINEAGEQYKAELKLWKEYAKAFSTIRDTMLHSSKLVGLVRCHSHHSRMLSVLKASEPHNKWQGTLTRFNHDGGIHGQFLNGQYVCDGLRMLREQLRTVRKKQTKKLLRVTMQLGQEVGTRYVERKPERYKAGRGKYERLQDVLAYGRTLKKYAVRIDSVVGTIGFREECDAACDERAQLKLSRLCRQVAANIHPSVATIPLSRPEVCGHVLYNGSRCPVLMMQCDTVGRREQRLQTMVLFFGKTGVADIDRRLAHVDWLHVSRSTIAPEQIVSYIQTMNERINYVSPAERSKRELRRQTACYARKLKRIEYLSLLDSREAGNCWPGTVRFCQIMGIAIGNDWNDTKIKADELLRRWKAQNWFLNGLFLKAIDTAYNRISKQLASVGGFY